MNNLTKKVSLTLHRMKLIACMAKPTRNAGRKIMQLFTQYGVNGQREKCLSATSDKHFPEKSLVQQIQVILRIFCYFENSTG